MQNFQIVCRIWSWWSIDSWGVVPKLEVLGVYKYHWPRRKPI